MVVFPPRVDELDWDDWNLNHIQKHGVTVAEVTEVPLADAMCRTTYNDRIMMTGPTSTGRMLTIVIGESPFQRFRWYVFSARPASRPERAAYQSDRKGEIA